MHCGMFHVRERCFQSLMHAFSATSWAAAKDAAASAPISISTLMQFPNRCLRSMPTPTISGVSAAYACAFVSVSVSVPKAYPANHPARPAQSPRPSSEKTTLRDAFLLLSRGWIICDRCRFRDPATWPLPAQIGGPDWAFCQTVLHGDGRCNIIFYMFHAVSLSPRLFQLLPVSPASSSTSVLLRNPSPYSALLRVPDVDTDVSVAKHACSEDKPETAGINAKQYCCRDRKRGKRQWKAEE